MRLFELTLHEYDVPDIKSYARRQHPQGVTRNFKPEEPVKRIGQGAYAATFAHTDAPHDILKVSAAQPAGFIREDGYIVYVKWLLNSEFKDSPYAPKFRSVRISDDNAQFQVRMERLEPLESLRGSELLNLIKQNFVDKQFRVVFDRYMNQIHELDKKVEDGWITASEKRAKMKQYIGGLTWAVVECAEDVTNMQEDANDPELTRFLRAIRKVALRADYFMDINNPGNIMVRRGPTGLQLVVTDPIGSVGAKEER